MQCDEIPSGMDAVPMMTRYRVVMMLIVSIQYTIQCQCGWMQYDFCSPIRTDVDSRVLPVSGLLTLGYPRPVRQIAKQISLTTKQLLLSIIKIQP